MIDDPVLHLLRTLPPDLPNRPDRFDRIHDRVLRHRRRRAAGTAVLAVLLVAGGATAVGLHGSGPEHAAPTDIAHEPSPSAPVSLESPTAPTPGAPQVTSLAAPVTTSGTGRQTVQLGARPAGADTVSTALTCLSAGTIRWPDGASLTCGASDLGDTHPSTYDVPLDAGQTTLLIRADPGTSWRLVTTYAHTEQTAWGVNADGLTYGVQNDRGTPDLVSVATTDGRVGYAYADQLDHPFGPDPTSPADALAQQQEHAGTSVAVPVYTSDGHTRVGTFVIEPGHATTVAPAAQPTGAGARR